MDTDFVTFFFSYLFINATIYSVDSREALISKIKLKTSQYRYNLLGLAEFISYPVSFLITRYAINHNHYKGIGVVCITVFIAIAIKSLLGLSTFDNRNVILFTLKAIKNVSSSVLFSILDFLILELLKERDINYAVFSKIRIGIVFGRILPEILRIMSSYFFEATTYFKTTGIIVVLFGICAMACFCLLYNKKNYKGKNPTFSFKFLNWEYLLFILCIALQAVPARVITSNLFLLISDKIKDKERSILIAAREIFGVIASFFLPFFEAKNSLESIAFFSMLICVLRVYLTHFMAMTPYSNTDLFVFLFLEALHSIHTSFIYSLGPRIARKLVPYEFAFYAQMGYYMAFFSAGPILISLVTYSTLTKTEDIRYKNNDELKMFYHVSCLVGIIGILMWGIYVLLNQKRSKQN